MERKMKNPLDNLDPDRETLAENSSNEHVFEETRAQLNIFLSRLYNNEIVAFSFVYFGPLEGQEAVALNVKRKDRIHEDLEKLKLLFNDSVEKVSASALQGESKQ